MAKQAQAQSAPQSTPSVKTGPTAVSSQPAAEGQEKVKRPRGPRGPSLAWTPERLQALVTTIKSHEGEEGGVTLAALVEELKESGYFDGVRELVTVLRTGQQVLRVRKALEEAGKTAEAGVIASTVRRGTRGAKLDLDTLAGILG